MIHRCYEPADKRYKHYGGRGITVCDKWRYSFEEFFKDMGKPPAGRTLERKDNDKGYSPENCIWATYKQQSRNKSNNRFYSLGEELLILADIAERFGHTRERIKDRLKRGMTLEAALAAPRLLPGESFKPKSETRQGKIKAAGIDSGLVYWRMRQGLTFEEALSKPVRQQKRKGKND